MNEAPAGRGREDGDGVGRGAADAGGVDRALVAAILDGLDDAVFAKDDRGRYVLVNEAAAAWLGRPAEQIVGRTDAELVGAEDARRARVQDRKVLDSGKRRTGLTIERRGGPARDLLATKWPWRDAEGRVVGLVGIARDVTAARRAEAALSDSEAKYRLLAENSTDLISRHAPDGAYLYASPASRSATGYEPDELVGRSAYEFIEPADHQAVLRAHDAVLGSGEPVTVAFRIRRKDGGTTWLESTCRALYDAAGRLTEIHVASRDVTARRLAEEDAAASRRLLQAVADNVTSVLYVKDMEGRYILVNRRHADLFATGERHLGKTDVELFGPEVAATLRANDRRAIESGGPLECEEEVAGRDGERRTYISVKVPLRDDEGRAYALCGISTDITERKRHEEGLRQQNELLQAAVRSERAAHEALRKAEGQLLQAEKLAALGQMVAGVAHEVNNPLAFALNNLAVLRRDAGQLEAILRLYRDAAEGPAEGRAGAAETARGLAERLDVDYTLDNLARLVDRSVDGLRRIQRIMMDLLDFARPDESAVADADLNAGVEATINLARGRAKERGVALSAELGALPPVSCFPGKVNQVIMNLVANAVDATPSGGRVVVRTGVRPGGMVAIEVEDTGTGIDPALRDRIFDPFFTTKPIGQGTGLGLSLSYGIVRAHGGSLDFESEPGRGTRFTVTLPAVAG